MGREGTDGWVTNVLTLGTEKESCQPPLQSPKTETFFLGDTKPVWPACLSQVALLPWFSLAIWVHWVFCSFLQREVVLMNKCWMNKSPRVTYPHHHRDVNQVNKGNAGWSTGFWGLNSELVFPVVFALHTSWCPCSGYYSSYLPMVFWGKFREEKSLEKHHERILLVVRCSKPLRPPCVKPIGQFLALISHSPWKSRSL